MSTIARMVVAFDGDATSIGRAAGTAVRHVTQVANQVEASGTHVAAVMRQNGLEAFRAADIAAAGVRRLEEAQRRLQAGASLKIRTLAAAPPPPPAPPAVDLNRYRNDFAAAHAELRAHLDMRLKAIRRGVEAERLAREEGRRQELAAVQRFAREEVALRQQLGRLDFVGEQERANAARRRQAAIQEAAEMAERGRRSAAAYAAALSRGMNNAQANIGRWVTRVAGPAAPVAPATSNPFGGSRAQNVALGAVFALSGLGDAVAAAESNLTRITGTINTVLKSLSGFALFFGPKGWIVAGVGAALSAVLDFFGRTRDEASRTLKQMEDRVRQLINSRDSIAQMARIQELEIGEAAAGPSARLPNVFAGGIADLQRQVAEQERLMKSANLMVALAAKRAAADLESRLNPLLEEKRRLMAALMNPVVVPEIRGATAIAVSAPAPGFETAELQRTAQRLLTLYRTVSDSGRPAIAEAQRLVAVYFALGTALDSIKNPFDDQAVAVKTLRREIERLLPVLDRMRGLNLPAVSLTPTPPTRLPQPTITPPRIDATPNFSVLQRTLGVSIGNMVERLGNTVGTTLAAVLKSVLGPVALLFRAMEPALQVLTPLLDSLLAPLAALLQVVAVGLEPVLRLLFPILRAIAVVFSVLYEVVARVTAGLAQAIGGLIVGIGRLLNKLPGSIGNPLIKFGESLLGFANGARASADQMAATRDRLERMQFGDTADSVSRLGDAAAFAASELLNVPHGFRIALERYLATTPIVQSTTPTHRGSGTSTGSTPTTGGTTPAGGELASIHFDGPVTINTSARSPEEFFRDVARVAQEESLRRFGTTARAGETFAKRR